MSREILKTFWILVGTKQGQLSCQTSLNFYKNILTYSTILLNKHTFHGDVVREMELVNQSLIINSA